MTNIISKAVAGMTMAAFAFAIVLSAPQHAHAYYYQNYSYPPAPNYYTIPSVQVVYANGYYQNYFVPTVRYFPAVHPLPVPTTYYPTQPPAFTYQGANNFPGNYGYGHNW